MMSKPCRTASRRYHYSPRIGPTTSGVMLCCMRLYSGSVGRGVGRDKSGASGPLAVFLSPRVTMRLPRRFSQGLESSQLRVADGAPPHSPRARSSQEGFLGVSGPKLAHLERKEINLGE